MQSHLDRQQVNKNTFRNSIQRELAELYQKTEDTFVLDNEIRAKPEIVSNDALFLLEVLFNSGAPTPDITWTKHGSLRLNWYPDTGTATMELCGDGIVVYNAFFDEDRQDDGACLLTDAAALDELLGALRCVL